MSDEGDIYQPNVEFAMVDKSRTKRVGFIFDEGKDSEESAGETDLGMVSPVFNFADPDATVDVILPSAKADYVIKNDGEYDDDDDEEEETDENNDDGDDEDDGDDNEDDYEQSGEHVKEVLYQKHKTTSGGFHNSARKHTIETKTTIEQRTVTVAVTETKERFTKNDDDRNINEPMSSQKLADQSKTEVSSLDINLDKLKQSGKIERVAVFNLQGQPLACCNHTNISAEDGRTVALTLDSSYNGMTRLRIGKMDFKCFRKGQNSSLVGWSDSDFLYVSRGENFIVLALSDPASPGSSIYEVSRFMERCSNDRTSSFVAGLS